MSFLMTKVGLNVFFSINQSVSHHNIMVLLPYVSQLSNVTSQLKDIYGLHVGVQLVMMTMPVYGHVVLTSPEGLLILYKSGIFAIDISTRLGVYWKRQKRTYQSPSRPARSYAKCSRVIHASSCGTVALYGLFINFFSWQTIGLRISLDQKFTELPPRIRRTF